MQHFTQETLEQVERLRVATVAHNLTCTTCQRSWREATRLLRGGGEPDERTFPKPCTVGEELVREVHRITLLGQTEEEVSCLVTSIPSSM